MPIAGGLGRSIAAMCRSMSATRLIIEDLRGPVVEMLRYYSEEER